MLKHTTYDEFHKEAIVQKKVISDKNFTYRNILGILKKELTEEKLKILDYGCGVGTIDFYLAHLGHSITGIDISPKAIRVCKSSAKEIGVASNTTFKLISQRLDNEYDLIICSELIEHVPDDIKLLEKLTILLKKGGKLLISTPTVDAPLYKLNLAKDFDIRVGHLRRYVQNELIEKVTSQLGLKIIQVKRSEGILRNSLFIFPSLNWIIKFLKGPLSDLVTFIDDALVIIFGESNIFIVAQKL